MKRREFLKKLPLGFGAAMSIPLLGGSAFAIQPNRLLSALANPLEETDRVLVLVFLRGGNDGLNTIVPFTNPTYDLLRKNTGFVSSEEKARLKRKLSDNIAFNPYMDKFANLWDEGKVAAVQNIGIFNPNLSHFRAMDIWNQSCDHDQLLTTGWIGRWMELENPSYPIEKPQDPIAIAMGVATSGAFQGTKSSVEVLAKDPQHYIPFGSIASDSVPSTLGGDELTYVREMMSISDYYGQRFSQLFPKYAKNMVEYPSTAIGDQFKHVAWCIASGLKTKIYFVEQDGYDTHFLQSSKYDVEGSHARLLHQLSESLYSFQRDLEAFGLQDRVITMTYSEFGRRAFENGDHSSGTDHGTAAPHFVIGSQVNGGLYGPDPNLELRDENGDPFIDFEFRQMYASVMGDWFGVSKETCTSVLSPDRDRAPFETEFPLNDGSGKRSLIKPGSGSRVETSRLGSTFKLRGNYPNPASSHTRIMFDLTKTEDVKLQLFDARGTLMTTLINARLGAGEHAPELRTAELASGSYVYRLTVGERSETRRLNIVR